jgi:hypothetical protein
MKKQITLFLVSILALNYNATNMVASAKSAKKTTPAQAHLNMPKNEFKLIMKDVLLQLAKQQGTTVEGLLKSKKTFHTPVQLTNSTTNIKTIAAQKLQQAKQKAKKTSSNSASAKTTAPKS